MDGHRLHLESMERLATPASLEGGGHLEKDRRAEEKQQKYMMASSCLSRRRERLAIPYLSRTKGEDNIEEKKKSVDGHPSRL